MRGFVKHFKVTEKNFLFPEHKLLFDGCQQHYHDDKIFHQSWFFNYGNSVFTELVKQINFEGNINRKWFLGHVFFELYVDRFLVLHLPKLVNKFYNDLLAVDVEILKSFLTCFNCIDVEASTKIFLNFSKVQYIKNYPDNNLFIYSLSRIMMRAKAGNFTLSDNLFLYDTLHKIDNLILKDKLRLLYLLHQTF